MVERRRPSKIQSQVTFGKRVPHGYIPKHYTPGLGLHLGGRLYNGPLYNWSDRLGKRCFRAEELNRMDQCCSSGQYQPPTCIQVQQQPIIIAKKNIVYAQKCKPEPAVINTTRVVMVPKVIKVERAVRVPEVIWTEGYVKYPKIEYCKRNVCTYEVKQQARNVMTPQEICTMFLCRPRPQYILVPPPTDYCCYPLNAGNQQNHPMQMEVDPMKLACKYPNYIGSLGICNPYQNFMQQSCIPNPCGSSWMCYPPYDFNNNNNNCGMGSYSPMNNCYPQNLRPYVV